MFIKNDNKTKLKAHSKFPLKKSIRRKNQHELFDHRVHSTTVGTPYMKRHRSVCASLASDQNQACITCNFILYIYIYIYIWICVCNTLASLCDTCVSCAPHTKFYILSTVFNRHIRFCWSFNFFSSFFFHFYFRVLFFSCYTITLACYTHRVS